MTSLLSEIEWNDLLQLAERGDSEAQFTVAWYFEDGLKNGEREIIRADKVQAFKWFDLSSENGNMEARIRVADYLSEGKYCERNLEQAVEFYNQAIEKGYSYAAINLATLYRDSNDLEKAFLCYQTAQSLDKTNLIELAYCYQFGIGTNKNKQAAFDIFDKIAKDTSEFRNCEYEINEANYYLGMYYLEGEIVERSIKKARTHLLKANEDNDHKSANELLLIIGKSI